MPETILDRLKAAADKYIAPPKDSPKEPVEAKKPSNMMVIVKTPAEKSTKEVAVEFAQRVKDGMKKQGEAFLRTGEGAEVPDLPGPMHAYAVQRSQDQQLKDIQDQIDAARSVQEAIEFDRLRNRLREATATEPEKGYYRRYYD